MNILQIQDTLKDLSDAQLAQQMKSPDGSAPQYLVLSEMQRRKEMRAKMPQPPPETSMAEEAVEGIAALPQAASVAPPGAEEMPQEPQMMADGGEVDEDSLTPWQSLWRRQRTGAAANSAAIERQRRVNAVVQTYRERTGPLSFFNVPQGQRNEARDVQDWAHQNRDHLSDPEALAAFERDPAGYMRQRRALTPPATSTAPATAAPATAATTAAAPAANAAAPATNAAADGARQGSARGQGIASVPQASGRSLEDYMRSVPGSDGTALQELREELRGNRTNPTERRGEAGNLALMEAGMRMMGSTASSPLGALGDAAPALQSYGQQLGAIRRDQRNDALTRLQLERAQNDDTYRRAQVGASLYTNAEDNRTRIQAANIGADATRAAAAAQRNQTLEVAEWVNSAPDEDARQRRLEAVGRSQHQLTGQAPLYGAMQRRERELIEAMPAMTRPGQREAADAELRQLQDRMKEIENSILRRPTAGAPAAAGARPDPLGLRQ